MILVDTSAWVEYLRGTGSAEAVALRQLLRSDLSVACCDPIRMEVLAGARDARHLAELRGLLGRAQTLPVLGVDYEAAAAYARTCRAAGVTVRSLVDCLIAAVAIRSGVPLLHRDEDFTALAAVTPLAVAR